MTPDDPKTHDDLLAHFEDQMGFLRTSAERYDQGDLKEAVRLATTLRVLLHDTKNSQSLLKQLGIKKSLSFVDTRAPISTPRGAVLVGGLLAPMRLGATNPGGAVHFPMLGDAEIHGREEFYDWWWATVIGTHDGVFSRKDTVLALANKEGGAHVDFKLPREYSKLRRLGVGFVFTNSDGDLVDGGNPALPTVRQIAYEVEMTLQEQARDLLA